MTQERLLRSAFAAGAITDAAALLPMLCPPFAPLWRLIPSGICGSVLAPPPHA